MAEVLVFSKDRPMQLHAYLESLLLFSNIGENDVSVLYYNTDNIHYDKVKSEFPNVNWIEENNFYLQVIEWVKSRKNNYIMFGCDDVVFKDYFDFNIAERFLEEKEDVFGFSIRLGKNIEKFPKNVFCKQNICWWRWDEREKGHFYYPWELDCTIYRKKDVDEILMQKTEGIINPNYLEEFVALEPQKYISRKSLACFNERSKAIVITINRVQETHQNEVDESLQTDPETLAYLYNEKDVRLDVRKIAKKRNRIIHVGNDFFLLNQKIYKKKMYKRWNQLKQLLRNIILLAQIDLKSEGVEEFVLKHKFEILDEFHKCRKPNILTFEETVEILKKQPKSFCRMGDGELELIKGNSIPFQKYDGRLKEYLEKILRYEEKDIYVGLPYYYFGNTDNLTSLVEKFVRTSMGRYVKIIEKYVNYDKKYIDTTMSQVYQTYKEYDFENYYKNLKNVFSGRDIVLVIGEGIYQQYTYNLLEFANVVDVIEAPSRNAFDDLENILDRLDKCSKENLICVVLGPTAKPIVLEMTKKNYMVWDIGHMLKDYDAYMHGKPRTEEAVALFYKPD